MLPVVLLLITDDPELGVWVASNLLLTLFAALSEAALPVLLACALPDHVVPCMATNLRSVTSSDDPHCVTVEACLYR
jgi:hypothetical protein